jgi:hypothetical protein
MTKPDKDNPPSPHDVIVRRVRESSPGSAIRVDRIELTREVKTAIGTSFESGRTVVRKSAK